MRVCEKVSKKQAPKLIHSSDKKYNKVLKKTKKCPENRKVSSRPHAYSDHLFSSWIGIIWNTDDDFLYSFNHISALTSLIKNTQQK